MKNFDFQLAIRMSGQVDVLGKHSPQRWSQFPPVRTYYVNLPL